MRVSSRSAPAAASGPSGARSAGGASSRFTLGGSEAAARPAAVQAAAPAGALAGLLALQAAGDATERRRRAVKRGRNLLDSLDGLKVALLSGRIGAGRMETLRAQLRQRAAFDEDPRLADIIAHIELRAEVELAKLAGRKRADG